MKIKNIFYELKLNKEIKRILEIKKDKAIKKIKKLTVSEISKKQIILFIDYLINREK